MQEFIGCDPHKKYSVFVTVNERGQALQEARVGDDREQKWRLAGILPTRRTLEAKKRMDQPGKKTAKRMPMA
jgi:hypothetical protein